MASENSSSNLGMGMLIGVVLVGLIAIMFFAFNNWGGTAPSAPTNTQSGNSGGSPVSIPDEVDVNINSGE